MRHRQKIDPDQLEARGSAQPRYTKKDFTDIGDDQRGSAESAMMKVQRVAGGGVLSVLVEHAGDIIHRANDVNTFEWAGYPYVLEKVDMLLRYMKRPYGFEREYRENVASNAEYRDVDPAQLQKDIDEALLKYASEHGKLRSLNEAHRVMKSMCVAIGHQNFALAHGRLVELKAHLGSTAEWKSYAHEGLIE
jgi:hypothetical protein